MASEFLPWAEGFGLSDTVALAAVAVVGYLFGRRSRLRVLQTGSTHLCSEFRRAAKVAEELELTAESIRNEVSRHMESISRFKGKLEAFDGCSNEQYWESIGDEADALLGPTLRMATQLNNAYEKLRKQSTHLVTFAESRIDRLSGLHNRRAFHELLRAQLQVGQDLDAGFSVALITISQPTSKQGVGAEEVQQFASLLDETRRFADVPAHTSLEEFAVLLPLTRLTGAAEFAKRLMRRTAAETDLTVCCAVVSALRGESDERLLSRAGSALYSARTTGQSSLFVHNGVSIQEWNPDREDPPANVFNAGFPGQEHGDSDVDTQPEPELSAATG